LDGGSPAAKERIEKRDVKTAIIMSQSRWLISMLTSHPASFD